MGRVGFAGVDVLISMGISLGMTLVLELIFALTFKIWSRKDLLLVCLVNLITNPAVVFLYYLAAGMDGRYLVLLVLEVLAVIVEALYYKVYTKGIRRPVLFAAGANAFSFLAGKLIETFMF